MSQFIFGAINDRDETLKGKSVSVVFGLNESVNLIKAEFLTNAGKNNAPGIAVDFTFLVNDAEVRRRFYDVTTVFKKDRQLTPNDPEFAVEQAKQYTQITAAITHIIKAVGVTDQMIQAAFQIPAQTFGEWAQRMIALLPPNFNMIPVDLFCEYQWSISQGQDKTYLEIPNNMKGGYFCVAHRPAIGQWTAEHKWVTPEGRQMSGLRYIDNGGNVHEFTRDQNYMESNKANQQNDNLPDAGQSTMEKLKGVGSKVKAAAPTNGSVNWLTK